MKRTLERALAANGKLVEAAPVTGGIAFELLELDDEEYESRQGGRFSRGKGRGRGKPGPNPRRKAAKAKTKDAKTKRKVTRKRRSKD